MRALTKLGLKTGLDALYWSRVHRLVGPLTEGAGAILMFHHVRSSGDGSFRPNPHLDVTPDFLKAVVARLRQLDIDIVDLDEAARRIAVSERGRRFAVLTFDDGYRNNLTEAYPILKAAGAPFTVYVTSGLVDRAAMPWWDVAGRIVAMNDHVRVQVGARDIDLSTRTMREKAFACETLIQALGELGEDEQRIVVGEAARRHGVDVAAMIDAELLNWDEVRTLASDPLVTIGAHTVGHFALARLDADRAEAEMRDSQARIGAMIGTVPRHFAYPYGSARSAGSREFALAEALGFATAVTTRRGVLRAGGGDRLTALPRVSVNGGFQAIRYLDLFLSGLPYVLEGGLNRFRTGSFMPSAIAATASTQ